MIRQVFKYIWGICWNSSHVTIWRKVRKL